MEGLLLPLILMLVVAVPLVLGTRKQKKQMQQQQTLQNSLVDGDRVMTTSGLYATIVDASDDTTVDLEIAEGVVTTWLRQAIREKVHPDGAADAEDDAVNEEDQGVDDDVTAATSRDGDGSTDDALESESLEKEKR